MRNFFLILYLQISLFILAGFPLHAQSDSMSVSFGTGWNHSKILDEYISPMQYKGGGFLLKLGLDEYNERYYNHVEMIFQNNIIEPDLNNGSSADLYRGNIDWIRAWKLYTDTEILSLYFGAHLLASYGGISHNVWYNNSYSHSLALNIGPSFVLSAVPLSSSRDLLIACEVSFPLLNYIIRPSRSSILPDGAISKGEKTSWSVVTGGKIASLDEYRRVYSNLFISTRITPKFNIRLGYQSDFQNYTVNNRYQSVNRLLYIGIHYKFKI